MKMRSKQQGMSILGILVILIMVGFFVMCAIKMFPGYFEYLSVREVIRKAASDYDPQSENLRDIRRKVDNLFNTNQIYDINSQDVEIYRKDGKTYIDANYEMRVPIMGRIDAVMRFDDLLLVAGRKIP
jgi:cell division protein FtsL